MNVAQAADAPEFVFLQNAQKLRLQTEFEFADLVEEDRAAVRLFEQAFLAGFGVGKCASFVAEKLGFDQVGGQRRAVDR
jgi:hypothetical protein